MIENRITPSYYLITIKGRLQGDTLIRNYILLAEEYTNVEILAKKKFEEQVEEMLDGKVVPYSIEDIKILKQPYLHIYLDVMYEKEDVEDEPFYAVTVKLMSEMGKTITEKYLYKSGTFENAYKAASTPESTDTRWVHSITHTPINLVIPN